MVLLITVKHKVFFILKKYSFLVTILILSSFNLFSTPFSEGKELFEKNSVEEAVFLFEESLITAPTVDVYKYLAECYNILGMHDDETLVLEEAIFMEVGELSYFHFKLGNAYYLIEDYSNALNSYLKVIELKSGYINDAFLNIANVSVELELFSSAIDNYTKYLELDPETSQKRKIIKMIFLLKRAYKEQITQLEIEQRVAEEARLASEMENHKEEESRLEKMSQIDNLESEREIRTRELEEQRLLYENAEQSLLEDIEDFEIAEEQVLNPPDPDIESQRKILELREEELNEREIKLNVAEQALHDAEAELARMRDELMASNVQAPSDAEYTDSLRVKTEEELMEEELVRVKQEERQRQEAVMSDILESLEKIGENAKGINAGSEDAYDELEGSDIDE